ncbi:MAG: lysyl oxidase family protein [Candidatus Zixiibacteriota bacterium]
MGDRRTPAGLFTLTLSVLVLAVSAPDCAPASPAVETTVVDLLPDIIVRQSDLYNNDIVTTIEPGHVHLRFANATPNVGPGKLELVGILPPINDTQQVVDQRIFRSDGTSWEREAGTFIYHPTHEHIHFEGWCLYRLREILPADGVGPVVAQGAKTSFCIVDLAIYDSSVVNFNRAGEFFFCSREQQGISVGWLDLYSKGLPGQNIDITDVPPGVYWLEAEADPDNKILEANEGNNTARVKVTIGGSGGFLPDAYEPNDDRASVDSRPVGQPNSPNLGPCNPLKVISNLSIHAAANGDYFKFYACDPGAAGDFVRIDFLHGAGDLDMRLLDAAGSEVARSDAIVDSESISLAGRSGGWYYVHVYGYNNAVNPIYELTINPPSSNPPTLTILDPPAGNVVRVHGFENYTVTWLASDPDSDPTWVTLYVNAQPVLDGNQIPVEASEFTDGPTGFHVLNSASIPPGTWWVYGEVTDGGATTGNWSAGTITFAEAADADHDGVFDVADNCPTFVNPGQEDADSDGVGDACDNCPYFPNADQVGCLHHGDPDPNGTVNLYDVVHAVDIAFRSGAPLVDVACPHAPAGRTDVNCDGVTNVTDVLLFIDVAFRDTPHTFCNPCACNPYPSGCPQIP